MDRKEKSGIALPSLEYGSYIGLTLVLLELLQSSLMSQGTRESLGWLSPLFLALLLVLFTHRFREKDNDASLTYSRGLGVGTLMSLFASIILSIYTFFYMKFTGGEVVTRALSETKKAMEDEGVEGEQLETVMSFYQEYIFTPFGFSFIALLFTFFTGFLASLLIPLFLKKNPAPDG